MTKNEGDGVNLYEWLTLLLGFLTWMIQVIELFHEMKRKPSEQSHCSRSRRLKGSSENGVENQ